MPRKKTAQQWTEEDLAQQAAAAASLVEYLMTVDEDDDDLIEDTIEGETDFKEVLTRAIEMIDEANMMATALDARITLLKRRKDRFKGQAEHLKRIMEMAMAQANGFRDLKEKPFTMTLDLATITLRIGKAGVRVSDEALLPSDFWKALDPVINKTKLNEYVAKLGADDALPEGVEITEPGFQLQIRRN